MSTVVIYCHTRYNDQRTAATGGSDVATVGSCARAVDRSTLNNTDTGYRWLLLQEAGSGVAVGKYMLHVCKGKCSADLQYRKNMH